MTRLCLDTSAYSNFQRGEPRVIEHVDRAERVGVPSVVIGELRAGFLLGTRAGENIGRLEEFLSHPAVEVLFVDEEVARIYGEIFVDLRHKGRPIPTNDIWIAATAARAGATVLTFDEHFREITHVGALVLDQAGRGMRHRSHARTGPSPGAVID